jgi:RHH-type transcriptional regulator, rel operon repressor / antitoxin RelB
MEDMSSGSMLSIRLDLDIERRLDVLAKRTGRTKSFLARGLIENGLEDLEERYLAEVRLEKRRPALTSGEVRQQLGVTRSAPVKKSTNRRLPGIDKGKIWIADDF